jgi:hypothetical protein
LELEAFGLKPRRCVVDDRGALILA